MNALKCVSLAPHHNKNESATFHELIVHDTKLAKENDLTWENSHAITINDQKVITSQPAKY